MRYNILNKIKNIIKDNKGQISLEFLLIMAVVVLGAIGVGFYLKQISAKNSSQTQDLQSKSLEGTN